MKKDWRENVRVLLTGKCDAHCRYCAYQKAVVREDLPLRALLTNVFPYVDRFCRVSFCGGEPTLHRHFRKVVEAALKKTSVVQVVSNGACVSTVQKEIEFRSILDEFPNLRVLFSADTQHAEGVPGFSTRLERSLALYHEYSDRVFFYVCEPTYNESEATRDRLGLPRDHTDLGHLHQDIGFRGVVTKRIALITEIGAVYERETDLLTGMPPLGSVLTTSLRQILAATY